jgi:hypothetical protein
VSKPLEPIGDAVQQELGRFGRGGAIAEIVAAWPEAVGELIARNAWPARIARDGTLHVTTSSSTWVYLSRTSARGWLLRSESALQRAFVLLRVGFPKRHSRPPRSARERRPNRLRQSSSKGSGWPLRSRTKIYAKLLHALPPLAWRGPQDLRPIW